MPSNRSARNAAVYFEIPVQDLDRAIAFYSAVFGYEFQREIVDGNEMALFPEIPGAPGISGALAKGEVYVPAKAGPVLYLATDDLEATMAKAMAKGAKQLYPKTKLGQTGWVAEFEDSEGNRIALHQR